MEKPFFSIIIATYNAQEEIVATLKSIDAQTFQSFELIVIDGLSNDNTIDTLKSNYHKLAFLISEKDNGVFDAWNKGLAHCKANWVLFLGAGDMLMPRALEHYHEFLDRKCYKKVDYCSSKILALYDNSARIIGKRFDWATFKRYMNVAHVGSVHSMNLFEQYGLFNDTYKLAGDYEMLLRPRANLRAVFMNKITVLMPMDGQSNRVSKVLREAYRAKIETGGQRIIPSYYLYFYSVLLMKLKNLLFYNSEFDKRGKFHLDD